MNMGYAEIEYQNIDDLVAFATKQQRPLYRDTRRDGGMHMYWMLDVAGLMPVVTCLFMTEEESVKLNFAALNVQVIDASFEFMGGY